MAAEIEATKARDVPLPSVSSIVRKTTGGSTSPTKVASGFNQDAAAVLLEEEIREVVYSTVGAAGASFFVAVFLSAGSPVPWSSGGHLLQSHVHGGPTSTCSGQP